VSLGRDSIGWRAWLGVGERRWKKAYDEEVQPAKTLWDWLQLLIVPAILIGVTVVWSAAQTRGDNKREDRRIAADNKREDRRIAADRAAAKEARRDRTLQAYLNQMSGLMLDKKLLTSDQNDAVRAVARTATLTTLRRLDSSRKSEVVLFLNEARLLDGRIGVPVSLAGAHLDDVNLESVDLTNASFAAADLRGADLSDTDLQNAHLAETKLRDADLSYAYLRNASFAAADLRGADLSGARFGRADLSRADLRGADLEDADLTSANLVEADLRGAILKGADLRKADFLVADLRGADLRGTILEGAYLHAADLTGANVTGADLTGAERVDLKGAVGLPRKKADRDPRALRLKAAAIRQ
jgi:uncharacterized protein YjbI with pentapeptide repeats